MTALRADHHTTVSGSLSTAYRRSEQLGQILAETILEPHNKKLGTAIRIAKVTAYLVSSVKKSIQDGPLSLVTLPKKLLEFGIAGAYEGLTVNPPTEEKEKPKYLTRENPLKPNALKTKEHKEDLKKFKKTYGTTTPGILKKLAHYSGLNEWHTAYDATKKRYEKHDKGTKQGMDTLLSAKPSTAKLQQELAAREAIKDDSTVMSILKTPLSWYDSARSVFAASTLWTQANTYRAGRLVGKGTKQVLTSAASYIKNKMSDQKLETLSQDSEFLDASSKLRNGIGKAPTAKGNTGKTKRKKRWNQGF